jgi:putative FmdB family regulatory protein
MPIYEFYCADCNTLFNFFSPTIDTEKRPDCPKCGRPELERRPARFATISRSSEAGGGDEEDPFAGLDESRMEAAMASLEQELGGVDDGDPDPRQLATALRRVGEASGLEMGPKMEEMLARMEGGADLDALEDDMESLDDSDDSFEDFFRLKRKAAALAKRPRVDDELYFL